MLFFGATVGRSGSTWLAETLNQSATHQVRHEEADLRDPAMIHGWSRFPYERFADHGPNYGEVHGFLGYHLSAGHEGMERLIPRRFVLERETRAVVRSWMNRDGRQPEELAAVIFEVTTRQRLLREWAASDKRARVVKLETLTTDLRAFREFSDWLGIDFTPTRADQERVTNANPAARRDGLPPWEWDEAAEALLWRIVWRQSPETKRFWVRAGLAEISGQG